MLSTNYDVAIHIIGGSILVNYRLSKKLLSTSGSK